jgi:hypothetical protein
MDPINLLDEFYEISYSERSSEEEETEQEVLGKRRFGELKATKKPERPKKYLDPLTGAYYNNIEEFKKIRTLWNIRKSEDLCYEKNILKKFFIVKKKKISFKIFDQNN